MNFTEYLNLFHFDSLDITYYSIFNTFIEV